MVLPKFNHILDIVERGHNNQMSDEQLFNLYTDNFIEHLVTRRNRFGPINQKLFEVLRESFEHEKRIHPNSEIQRYETVDDYFNDPSPPQNFYIDKKIEHLLYALAKAQELIETAEENRRLIEGGKKRNQKKRTTKKRHSKKRHSKKRHSKRKIQKY